MPALLAEGKAAVIFKASVPASVSLLGEREAGQSGALRDALRCRRVRISDKHISFRVELAFDLNPSRGESSSKDHVIDLGPERLRLD